MTEPRAIITNDSEALAARLVLAHLDPDPQSQAYYRDLIRHESGIPTEHFHLADSVARVFAAGYQAEEAREQVRDRMTRRLVERA